MSEEELGMHERCVRKILSEFGVKEEGISCETIIGLIGLYGDLVIEK